MLTSEIISSFELYVDDTTELSSVEELALANKIYYKICSDRDWEFLKTEWLTTTTGANYIALPSDFDHFTENNSYTENNESVEDNKSPKVILVNGQKYYLINWSDRRQYANRNNYCYVDVANSRLYFTVTPATGLSISADYIKVPTALTTNTSPVFPARFHSMIYHGMAVDDMIIQIFDKARSYAEQNQRMFESYKADMALWNSHQLNY
ncbi:MAG: hypothetical protein JSS91_00790 [Bacteroidetes bacterium]|nr:hypothetical protein [Bacteroidota bacterium]